MYTDFQSTGLPGLKVFKKNIKAIALIAMLFFFFSKLDAQTFSDIIKQNNGVLMTADADNSQANEDFVWILDQNSWTNGSNLEKMRLSAARLWLNTAFSMPSLHEFAVDASGVAGGRFIVKSLGNVGIGAYDPGYKFVVSNGSHYFSVNPHGAGVDIHSTGNLAPHYQTDFSVYKGNIGSGSLKFRIDSDGKVGIGTGSPSSKLSVVGDGVYSNDILTNGRIWSGSNSTAGGIWVNSVSNTPTQFFGTYDNTTKMGLYINNRWSLIADSAGNIGIGAISPTAKLEIGGQVKITGGSPGAGKVLTSDANGLASWVANTSSQWTTNGANVGYTSGNVGIGIANPGYKLVVSNGTHSLSFAPHAAGMDLHSTGNLSPHYQTDFTIYRGNLGAGSPKFKIDSAGNVGIGTAGPTAKLEVSGQVKITGGTPGAGKVLTSDANGLASWVANTSSQWTTNGTSVGYTGGNIGVGTTSPSAKLAVSGSAHTLSIDPKGNGIDIHSTGDIAPHYQTNFTIYKGNMGAGSPKFKIDSDGNVGIGTASPNAKLEVSGQVKITGGTPGAGKVLTSDANGLASWTANTSSQWATNGTSVGYTGGNVGIGITNPSKGKLHIVGSLHVEDTSGKQSFHVSAGKQLVFVGDSAYIQYLATAGDTTSPIQKDIFSLWVSKGIVTEDLTFANVNEWDDYVFDENYELPALEKLAVFVKNNKHLPNIPSGADVKKNGYSVHRLNRGFLKTIEELTLYAIAQDQKIKALETEIAAQKAKLDQYETLAAEIEKLKTAMAELKK